MHFHRHPTWIGTMSHIDRSFAMPYRAAAGGILLVLLAGCGAAEAPKPSASSSSSERQVTKLQADLAALQEKVDALAEAAPAAEPVAADVDVDVEKEAAEEPLSYEGKREPAAWGTLKPEWATCAKGEQQSPVDITVSRTVNLVDMAFAYTPSEVVAVNNGHTIQVDVANGGSVTLDGEAYALKQFHFHRPSEHTVAGKASAMELHLVHADKDGKLAVLGVMLNLGEANAALAPVWAALPAERGATAKIPAVFDVSTLLPADHAAYRYQGSLTTPPCSEGVEWSVMKKPVTLSAAQDAAFAKIFTAGNSRPVQALGKRALLTDAMGD